MFDMIRQRHALLHEQSLAPLFTRWDAAVLRQCPTPQMNSIVWNIWHLLRIEDITLSRFVANVPQVHTHDGWQAKLGISVGHMGTAMTHAEVVELSDQIDLSALAAYQQAVYAQSAQILKTTEELDLQQVWPESHMHAVVAGEAVCLPAIVDGVARYWGALNVGRFVLDYTQVHPNLHLGEIGVIAGVLSPA
jgi:hypothetical protein